MGKSVIEKQLITAGTATTDPPGVLSVLGRGSDVTIYVRASAGVSAGAVTIEESNDAAYTGLWSSIVVVTTSAASGVTAVHIQGSFQAIRARISTNLVGGTVDVYGVASDG